MKKLMDKLNLIIGGAGLSISIKVLLEEAKNKSVKEELVQLNDTLHNMSQIMDKQSKELDISQSKFNAIDDLLDKLTESKTGLKNSLGENITEEGRKSLEEITSISDKIFKLINERSSSNIGNGGVSNLIDWNEFSKFYDQYINFLKSLNLEQLAALCNLISLLLFLLCIWNIVIFLYGDFLITYYNLEGKYPKLIKILNYRRVIQKFNLYFYTFCAFLFIGVLFFINLFMLLR